MRGFRRKGLTTPSLRTKTLVAAAAVHWLSMGELTFEQAQAALAKKCDLVVYFHRLAIFHRKASARDLPPVFCWTKMGAEAGQGLNAILRRKELERLCGNGVFAWGIGNSVGPAIRHARSFGLDALEVFFTPMKSAPKSMDVAPSTLVLWNSYEDEWGQAAPLPAHILVTSRGNTSERDGLKQLHYALICRSARSLQAPALHQTVDPSAVCNLVSQNRTGASQVTAVVRTRTSREPGRPYPVQFRATLAEPGFVRLLQPTHVSGPLLALYRDALDSTRPVQWKQRVETLRCTAQLRSAETTAQRQLFGR